MPHTLLSYLYRDASNYKAHGAILLSGEATSDLHRRLRESLIDGEYFIPEKVGVPSVREKLYGYSEGHSTADDHLLHELIEMRPATRQEVESMTPVAEVEEFVMRFEGKKRDGTGWWAELGTGLLDLLGP